MRKFTLPVALSAVLTLMASCANYTASPLTNLSSDVALFQCSDVFVVARAFNKADCKRFLDRDVIAEGYQPIQLFIQNSTDKEYLFALDRVGLSLAKSDEVAERVHTSTAGRATTYGIGALFFWPLVIPAIVDGIKSAKANDALDIDFSIKAARDQVIFRRSNFNKLLFVPISEYQSTFTVTLLEHESSQPKTVNVSVGS